MSIGTLTRRRVGVLEEQDGQGSDGVKGAAKPPDPMQQLSQALADSLERLGIEQPDESRRKTGIGTIPSRPIARPLVTVAPGIVVGVDEYEERFGRLDLDALREKMPPAVFKAFIRHVGAVSGRADLEVDKMSRIPD